MNSDEFETKDLVAERARMQGTPLMDSDIATFVWLGERPPLLRGDFTGWGEGDPAALAKASSGVWTYRLALPPDAYIEYAFFDGDQRLLDPLNPRRISNGVGGYNNYFYMRQAQPTKLVRLGRGVRQGRVTKHVLYAPHLIGGGKRTVHLYQPPVKEATPLVVVWDGQDYLRRARLNVMVDHLIALGRMRPVALAMVEHGGAARMIEYACSEATLLFLLELVLPLAKQQLSLIDVAESPGAYGVLGASMGGLMALYTAARLPHIFGHALSQSGAFSFNGYDSVLLDLFSFGREFPVKVWMDVGIYDYQRIVASNRRLRDMLVERGVALEYREYNAGHNYPAWRDDMWRGLEYLYGI